MSIIRCKMCGGTLEITPGVSVAVCEYCGTQQTLPRLDSEKKLTLFARANRLLQDCEFDKAAGVFESIVAEFPEEAEAYWGLVLSKFGIEYVDDPKTGRKIPTCHRSSYESVLDDRDLELVLKYADDSARAVYEAEANAIEELRRGILKVSSQEDPYDIFICYKETSLSGGRTLDSVLAQDIYTELTEKGYRVFFARISLEDRLGQEYESYIFAALNSARVMLAIGTEFEHFNAVWVKNEWSRYLQLIAAGKKKTLIPCYKDMDPYDMPKEFARLQAQDLGKVGAMQDLLRGIEKIIPKKSAEPVRESGNHTAQLVKRAYSLAENGEWSKTEICCEQLLNLDPENAQAYLVKLMVELRVNHQSELVKCAKPFDDRENYKKALEYAGPELVSELQGYIEQINARNEAERRKKEAAAKEAARQTKKVLSIAIPAVAACVAVFFLVTKFIIPSMDYKAAEELYTAGEFIEARKVFLELGTFKDASARVQDTYYAQGQEALSTGNPKEAVSAFNRMNRCDRRTEALISAYYAWAEESLASENFEEAYDIFKNKLEDTERMAETLYLQAEYLLAQGSPMDALAAVDGIADTEYTLDYYTKFAESLKAAGFTTLAAKLLDPFTGEYIDVLMENKEYLAAAAVYRNKGDEANYSQTIQLARQEIRVGDTVIFGEFEQDNVTASPEPIEWIVIHEEDGKYHLLSKYILTGKSASNIGKVSYANYDTSKLRNWLINDFLTTAFSEAEQSLLFNAVFEGPVRALSKNHIEKYGLTRELLRAEPTAYAKSQGVKTISTGYASWWLSTKSGNADFMQISALGMLDEKGAYIHTHNGVRPFITLDLSSVS